MNEIPLSLYIAISIFTLVLIIFTFIYNENIVRIITAFISMILSYTNAMQIVNGNVVLVQSDGETYSYIPVTNLTYNYFWLFMAIMMAAFTILFTIDMINKQFQDALEEKKLKDEVEYGI